MRNQNIRFVFGDFRREAEIAKNKTGPGKREDVQALKRMKKPLHMGPKAAYQALPQYGRRRLHSKRYSVKKKNI